MNSNNSTDGIAIIGMSGCFPGAKNLSEFWLNLRHGVESISFFSDEELEALGVDPAVFKKANYVKAYGILKDVELFDASFFGFSPREAEIIDPQQRLFLEYAWQAFESAGYAADQYKGLVGVYAGVSISTYWLNNLLSNQSFIEAVGEYQAVLGNDKDFLATRVSYKLNLKGPSVVVQTGCSTSLVAVHLACQALLNFECDMALAGAARVKVPRSKGYLYEGEMIYSPDGHCRAFDATARGTVGGEGVGIVVLKRLADALADGDYVHAIIKGSAINNDGSLKVGYTAPSVDGQSEVIVMAQAMAGVHPDTISYIEAHGTGTAVGDPIEVAALTGAFRTRTERKGFCAIGSVKTNLGHLDTAAGIAGLIKTTLALKNKQLPPSLHFQSPNPRIDFENSPFFVNAKLSDWKVDVGPRRAGVSSFGIGGTNAHVVLEEAPNVEPSSPSRPWQVVTLSARTSTALENMTANLVDHFKKNDDLALADVAYTLSLGRKDFDQRRVVVCQDSKDAATVLEALNPKRVFTETKGSNYRPIVFMFPGQGSQYVNMALELYQHERVFREMVDACSELLKRHMGIDLCAVLYSREEKVEAATQQLNQTAIAQPALFVIEYALANLLNKWGICPDAMIGHSIGEYVAACFAGVFSIEDALSLIAARGRLMNQLPAGSMLAVPLSEEAIRPLLDEHLSVAAANGPSLCVVSGPTQNVTELENTLTVRGVEARRLYTSHAFHSHMMDPILKEFIEETKKVKLNPPRLRYLSNVSGNWITDAEATDPSYWAAHLRRTVRFADGLSVLYKKSESIFVEVGPGQTLSSLAKLHPDKAKQQIIIPAMRRPQDDQSDVKFLLNAVGRLWLEGLNIDWKEFYADEKRHRLPLPTYPFERQRYWVESQQSANRDSPTDDALNKKPNVADWFYIPSWKHSVAPQLSRRDEFVKQQTTWVVFKDECGLGCQISTRLQQTGQEIVSVVMGQEFRKIDDVHFTVNPQKPKDYISLFQEFRNLNKVPCKILHFWTVTTDDSRSPTLESFERTQDVGLYSLLFLAQAVGEANFVDPLEIQVVSNNLHDITGMEGVSPLKATLLGACKVIPLEFQNINCRAIDIVLPELETNDGQRTLDFLTAELTTKSGDLVVAYRGNHRWVPFVEPVRLNESAETPSRLRNEGVYLITGGLGGVGLALAEYLTKTVRAKLILLGRSKLPSKSEWEHWLTTHAEADETSGKIVKLKSLESLGAEILVCSADVANLRQMRDVIANAMNRFGRIDGVVHCAGVADYAGVILRRSRETTDETLAAKVRGTLVLSSLLKDINLDFLILCSSLGSILYHSKFGQVGYCAANEFLNAFAHYNGCESGTFTVTINWCDWNERGMAVEAKKRWAQVHRVSGKSLEFENALSNAEGVDVFSRILRSNIPQVLVSTKDLNRSIDQDRSWSNLQSVKVGVPNSTYHRPDLENEYLTPRNETEKALVEIWQNLLGVDRVGIHDNFFDLGGHSLLAVRLISQVGKLTGERLTLASILRAPTIEEQAKLLRQNGRMTQRSYLVPIQPEGGRRPLFCVHAHDGNVLFWKELSHRLGPDQPFYGIPARGLDGTLAPDDRLEDMASRYAREIKSFQPEGPYFLGGHCMGGVVAFEMAQQLHAQGDKVALLALIDSFPPNQESLGSTLSIQNKIKESIQLIKLHSSNLLLLQNGEKLRYLQTRSNRLLYKIYMSVGVPRVSTARVRRNILNAGIQAMKNYKPKVYPGSINLFRATELPARFNGDPQMGWARLAAGGLETHLIPGYFSQIVYEPRVRVLAEKLRDCLDRARPDGLH